MPKYYVESLSHPLTIRGFVKYANKRNVIRFGMRKFPIGRYRISAIDPNRPYHPDPHSIILDHDMKGINSKTSE
jgi:hypothetical protein